MPILRDSQNEELHEGDTVQVTGTVQKSEGEELRVGFAESNEYFQIAPSRVRKTTSSRIGAAPQLRTPVLEVPQSGGGVKLVPRNEALAAQAQDEKLKTESIPTNSPAAQTAVKADEEPAGDTKPEGPQAPGEKSDGRKTPEAAKPANAPKPAASR